MSEPTQGDMSDMNSASYVNHAIALRLANPDITSSYDQQPNKNPYVFETVPFPSQYIPDSKGGPSTAAEYLYPAKASGANYTPWKYTYNAEASVCTPSGVHVMDPAAISSSSQPGRFPPKEPILALLSKNFARVIHNKKNQKILHSSPNTFVLGFGMNTRTLYLRCVTAETDVPLNAYQSTDTKDYEKPCAECRMPRLRARTVCWPEAVQYHPDKASLNSPYPFKPMMVDQVFASQPKDSPLLGPQDYRNPVKATGTLLPPYVALGGAVGRATNLHGAHASSVMPWVPLVTVPSGDVAKGFARFYGSLPVDINYYEAAHGPCYKYKGPRVNSK
jgi:hypothetical protein